VQLLTVVRLYRAAAKRELTVTFVSEVQPGLPWTFTPLRKSIKVWPR
jgi:cytochrome c oxidase assembly protein Cox11